VAALASPGVLRPYLAARKQRARPTQP
jgi:hypothetical protein